MEGSSALRWLFSPVSVVQLHKFMTMTFLVSEQFIPMDDKYIY